MRLRKLLSRRYTEMRHGFLDILLPALDKSISIHDPQAVMALPLSQLRGPPAGRAVPRSLEDDACHPRTGVFSLSVPCYGPPNCTSCSCGLIRLAWVGDACRVGCKRVGRRKRNRQTLPSRSRGPGRQLKRGLVLQDGNTSGCAVRCVHYSCEYRA